MSLAKKSKCKQDEHNAVLIQDKNNSEVKHKRLWFWRPKPFWKPTRYRFKRWQWQWQRLQRDQMLVKQVKNGWQKPWTWRLSADSALCTHGRNMWDMDKAFSGCGFIFIAWKPTWSKWQLFWHPPAWLSSCPRVSPASSVFRHIFCCALFGRALVCVAGCGQLWKAVVLPPSSRREDCS